MKRPDKKQIAFAEEVFPELNREQLEILMLKMTSMSSKDISTVTALSEMKVSRSINQIQKKFDYLPVRLMTLLFKQKMQFHLYGCLIHKFDSLKQQSDEIIQLLKEKGWVEGTFSPHQGKLSILR